MLADPLLDGTTHINAYSKGKTQLGRALSNFAYTPFIHERYGLTFASVESFWYWLSTGKIHDELRTLSGLKAKRVGRSFPRVPVECFEAEIKEAVECKIRQHPVLQTMFLESSLPFVHYYWYGTPGDRVAIKLLPELTWVSEYLNDLRSLMKDEG